ncbi:MAG: hypothetical protein KDK70_10690 [Myxococcales bacterium]|nr:hypothetical protein [Myxococcales bacterium]
MAELLTFLEQALGQTVPLTCRVWLRQHVDPEHACDAAHAVHLLWLTSCTELHDHAEVEAVVLSRVKLLGLLRDEQAVATACESDGAYAYFERAKARLRAALRSTRWWAELVERWEARQSRGLGVVQYDVRQRAMTSRVRGTHVGRFAVREVQWPALVRRAPALRHKERTPEDWRHGQGPRFLYAVDLVATGLSLGTFASAAVAFEVADRFDRDGVTSGTPPQVLRRLLDVYAGTAPGLGCRSWPAEPHWSFAACRRRAWGRRPRRRRARQRWEVRHGR